MDIITEPLKGEVDQDEKILDGNFSHPNIQKDQKLKDMFPIEEPKIQNWPVHEAVDVGDYILAQTYDLEHLGEVVEFQIARGYAETRKESTELPCVSSRGMKIHDRRLCPKIKINSNSEPPHERLYTQSSQESTSLSVSRASGSLNSPRLPMDLKRKSEKPKSKSVSNRSRRNGGPRKTRKPIKSSGHYLVVCHAIEECPMCYTELCPSRFTLNVKTFLLSTNCIGCKLDIYIKIDHSDGAHSVSILEKQSF
ncbi:uncharacterized protein LOC125034195 [Penaeus chinensis]|uniref:uncharacterized protein LOC125034195 n=1 Tax=Penaeus chinensis TaxID=139456 RepID=UPI001FB808FC|nr:uncharacterized protein LOC125034195 [Penaeus chinensis]